MIPRLFIEADLAEGAAVGLTAGQAHYVRAVLRLDRSAPLLLFNGRDGEWAASIEGVGKGWCSTVVVRRRREQLAEPDLWLVFAPVKRARLDFLVEKATELGASQLHPVFTRRTVVERVNLERLAANAVEAAEQTERLTVPRVHAPRRLDALLDGWPAERTLFLCDETGTAPPLAEAARSRTGPALAVMTGPEGGFAADELDALRKLPFVSPVGLGPRVLRADTAALAALAVVQAVAGDWAGPRVRRAPL